MESIPLAQIDNAAPLLSKLLTQLAYPLGLSLFFSLLAGVLFWRGRRRLDGLSLFFSRLVLWVPSLPAVFDSLRASLERRHPPVALEEVPKADAILVPWERPSRRASRWNLGVAGDRVLYAVQLYQAGKAPFLIRSGGRLPWMKKELAEAPALWRAWGVAEEAIPLESESGTTDENALCSRGFLEAHGAQAGIAFDLGPARATDPGAVSRPGD